MMDAEREPNIGSVSNGIIPNMVVSEAIITGRKRLCALSVKAVTGSVPLLICCEISSISTIPFFINIPISPNVPTIATKSKVFQVSSMTATTPTKIIGKTERMMMGLR